MDIAFKKWGTRRRVIRTDNVKTIEFVPGNSEGHRAYLWIGDANGDHYATVDALKFAEWFDSLRSDG